MAKKAKEKKPETETTEVVDEIRLTTTEINEDQAAEILLNGTEEPKIEDVASLEATAKYKAGREQYDIASIIGGRITHAIELEQSNNKTPLYSLVVEVDVSQGRPAQFLIVPINNFEVNAKVGHFDIQNLK